MFPVFIHFILKDKCSALVLLIFLILPLICKKGKENDEEVEN